jgi:hypothetical protein
MAKGEYSKKNMKNKAIPSPLHFPFKIVAVCFSYALVTYLSVDFANS